MRRLHFSVFALLPALLCAEDLPPLPPTAEMAVKNYQRDLGVIRDRAVKDLTAILNAETRRGNAKVAAAVQNAINSITGGAATPTTAAGAVGATAEAPLKSGKTTVKANEKFGAELGHFTPGMSLKLEYVEGKWAMSGGGGLDPTKWLSPDDPGTTGSNRMAIYAVDNGQMTKLVDVPSGTKKKAFRYRFERDYPMVCLRIVDSDPGDNPGFVIYNVETIKGN